MSESLFQRFVNRLLRKHDAASDDVEIADTEPTEPFEPRRSITSDVDSKRWFNGEKPVLRDAVESDPDSARWFRRPKFVAPPDTIHHPSNVEAARPSQH